MSFAEVFRRLATRYPNRQVKSRFIERLDATGVDYTHLVRNSGKTTQRAFDPDKKLVLIEEVKGTYTGQTLRRALVEIGRPYKCEECGNPGEWRGRILTLHVDHVDGNRMDCRRENLRFLCPNCHSQTTTFGNRGRFAGMTLEEIAEQRTCACGGPKLARSAQCVKCFHVGRPRIRAV